MSDTNGLTKVFAIPIGLTPSTSVSAGTQMTFTIETSSGAPTTGYTVLIQGVGDFPDCNGQEAYSFTAPLIQGNYIIDGACLTDPNYMVNGAFEVL